ncbi:hypothetical protein RvY_18033-2 [Ramazzottius varieornatus]|uniref:Glucuronosyltransferase n=1 Tax=Ramazzottius varieornatus TaxID=947166 RepID=A0A1D1W4A5_RAMVA|nr:hypothetical protein RvY_18033-2 [Ramazzottius varieornatus]
MWDFEKEAVKRTQADSVGGKLPLYFVGPLLSPESPSPDSTLFEGSIKVKAWLDAKPARSVVYFSLGTVGRPSKKEVEQISKGLLSLGQPFIMSLKADVHQYLTTEITDKIAAQFALTSKPFLILSCVPQRMVLSHRACAVLVSHCGWNSTLETLAYGAPVVAWPLFGDQELDAKKLEKQGVAKMQPTREITAAELAGAVREVAGFGLEDGRRSTYSLAAESWRIKLQAEQRFARFVGRARYLVQATVCELIYKYCLISPLLPGYKSARLRSRSTGSEIQYRHEGKVCNRQHENVTV